MQFVFQSFLPSSTACTQACLSSHSSKPVQQFTALLRASAVPCCLLRKASASWPGLHSTQPHLTSPALPTQIIGILCHLENIPSGTPLSQPGQINYGLTPGLCPRSSPSSGEGRHVTCFWPTKLRAVIEEWTKYIAQGCSPFYPLPQGGSPSSSELSFHFACSLLLDLSILCLVLVSPECACVPDSELLQD